MRASKLGNSMEMVLSHWHMLALSSAVTPEESVESEQTCSHMGVLNMWSTLSSKQPPFLHHFRASSPFLADWTEHAEREA